MEKVDDTDDSDDDDNNNNDDDDDDEETDVLLLSVFTGLSLLCVVALGKSDNSFIDVELAVYDHRFTCE